MSKQTAFVTGAGGFIGRHLVSDLLAAGYQVTALMCPGEAVPADWGDQVKCVEGDIRQLPAMAEAIGAFDVLFHLVAIVSDWGARSEHVDVTVRGTEYAIELALQQQARFIVTTSVCAYGDALAKGELTESSPVGQAISAYEFCKQEQERVTNEAVQSRGLKASIVRPGNVFGAGSEPWVKKPLEFMRAGNPILLGKGNWDAGLVYVRNLTHLMLLIADSEYQSGEVFLGSDGFGVTWETYLQRLATVAGTPPPKAIPNLAARLVAPLLEGAAVLVRKKERPLLTRQVVRLVGGENRFSTAKSKALLDYEPPYSFDEAMDELAAVLGR